MKTKIQKKISWQRILALGALCALVGLSISRHSQAQTVTEGYDSDQKLQRGMIVKLAEDNPEKIVPATRFTASDTIGVVVGANDSPITLASEGQQFYVASIGTYDVLASTQQGPINKGDYITVSSIEGVGMQATQDDDTVIGIALTEFDGSKEVASTPTLQEADGSERQIAVGRIVIDVAIGRNPNYKIPEPDVPTALRKFTEAIAGQQLSTFRIYMSLVIFVLSAAVAGSTIYSGVRNGMISIGRNPLGKKTVIKGMLQVITVGLIIFIAGIFGVYLVLRL